MMGDAEISRRALDKMLERANGDMGKILRIHEAKRALYMNRVIARYMAKVVHGKFLLIPTNSVPVKSVRAA